MCARPSAVGQQIIAKKFGNHKIIPYICSRFIKQYLIKGYAINQQHLNNYNNYNKLKEVVRLMSRAIILQDKVSEGKKTTITFRILQHAQQKIVVALALRAWASYTKQ